MELAMARALAQGLDGGADTPVSVRVARALALSLVDQLELVLAEVDHGDAA
jgi:hypothetical protein